MSKKRKVDAWLSQEQLIKHTKIYHIIDLIEQFIIDPKFSFIGATTIPLLPETNIEDVLKYKHPIDYLLANEPELGEQIITKQIIHGMLIDFCYFLQESISSAKRGRVVVAYSLLRRPLVYNFIILLRILYDENFFTRFISDSSYDPTVYKKEELKKMLDKFDQSKIISTINGDAIYDIVFNVDNPQSIINLSNRAIHPTTTRKRNQTGEMNFNFIFAIQEDIKRLLDVFYNSLLPILMCYFELFNIIIIQFANRNNIEELINDQYKKLLNCIS